MVGRTRTVQNSNDGFANLLITWSVLMKEEDDENMDEERDGDDKLLMGSHFPVPRSQFGQLG